MVTKKLIYWYLVLFPFGQLPKLIAQFLGLRGQFLITDFLILAIFVLRGFSGLSRQAIILITVFVWSWIFSLFNLGEPSLLPGGLYLIRFIAYLSFLYTIIALVNKKVLSKKLLLKAIIGICVAVAIFGWVQLFLVPDLRTLYLLGWDDHYFRLSSTFLDPAFTGIILLIGSWSSFKYYQFIKEKKYLFIGIFLALTIIPTYSRATFLSAFLLLFYSLFKSTIKKVHIVLIGLIFIFGLLFIPKPAGEGGNLFRTKSIELKFQNVNTAIKIVKTSPVFGVGFNNICQAKQELEIESGGLNACSGLDNSLLFVIATTGVAGLLVFIYFTLHMIKNTSKNYLGEIFLGVLMAVFIHGQFTNTVFYPWVLGSIAILGGISRRYGE